MDLCRALGLTAVLLLLGCSPQPGRARVTVVFENETVTRCLRVTAKAGSGTNVNATPPTVSRGTRDTFVFALAENSDLQGTVSVTVTRYASTDCASGTDFDAETRTVELVKGQLTSLEFRFAGSAATDGGTDAGLDAGQPDAGTDAGCDVSACPNSPGPCETLPATGCAPNGTCRFTVDATRTCDGGACNAMGQCVPTCEARPSGTACDDGLACTVSSTCSGTTCGGGNCAMGAPLCRRIASPISCDPTDAGACLTEPAADDTNCSQPVNGKCLGGTCRGWLPFPATILGLPPITAVPYPTDAWALGAADGGACDTVISTSGATPAVLDGGCGSPVITATVTDAGVALFTMTGLTVAANARLHLVGDRPALLLVLGDATVRGLVSVAPTVPGLLPAGSQPTSCSAVQPGDANREGGGGGGFGNTGGNGGEAGGLGGSATASVSVLRGGCAGGPGFGSRAGGVGGGALHLYASGTLTVGNGGAVSASGGGGSAGTADGEGGGGGGSGGMLILEAEQVVLSGGFVTANGGAGGEGGDTGQTSQSGANGPLASLMAAPVADATSSGGGTGGQGGNGTSTAGGNGGGGSSNVGGGGGGGSAGVVYVRGRSSCTGGTAAISAARPMSFSCN